MLEHGGRLRQAARHYGIALSDWVDLSTGINPDTYPIPPIDPLCWQRLPEDNDGLEAAAAASSPSWSSGRRCQHSGSMGGIG